MMVMMMNMIDNIKMLMLNMTLPRPMMMLFQYMMMLMMMMAHDDVVSVHDDVNDDDDDDDVQVQRESMHIITVSSNIFNNTVNPDLSQ